MTTLIDVEKVLREYDQQKQKEVAAIRDTLRVLNVREIQYQQMNIGLRSIEASLQADLKEKRDVIQAQSERIIELAAYRDELKVEVEQLRRQKATDQKIVTRNLELVKEVESLTTRNEALQSRCAALDHRVQVQKDEIDSLKFAMHKAGL